MKAGMGARSGPPPRASAVGFALLEVMLALAVLSAIAVTQARQAAIEAKQTGARILGNEIFLRAKKSEKVSP